MVKNLSLLIIMIACIHFSQAQISYIEIDYLNLEKGKDGSEMLYFTTLKDDGKSSLWITKDTSAYGGNMLRLPIDKDKFQGLFIDKVKNELYVYSPIFNKNFYLKEDSLTSLFKWEINDTIQKNVLGYECKLATCFFRGREYEVYYTEKLPFFAGPWKLTGLPGVILLAATKDGKFQSTAYQIVVNKPYQEIRNPYNVSNLNFLTFLEYKRIFLKKIVDIQKKAQSGEKDDDVTYTFEDDSIELLK